MSVRTTQRRATRTLTLCLAIYINLPNFTMPKLPSKVKQAKQYIITVFISLSFITLFGQVSKDTLTNYDPKNPTHLIIAYEQASQSLRAIRNKLLTGFDMTHIKTGYLSIQSRLDIYRRIGDTNLQDVGLSRMNDLISIFERQLANLNGWQESLLSTTKELSDFRIELAKHSDRLTLNQSGFNETQKKYYQTRHVPLINQADSLNGVVDEKLGEVLELELNISQDYAQLYNRILDLKSSVGLYWDNMVGREEVNWKLSGGDDTNFMSGIGDQFSKLELIYRSHSEICTLFHGKCPMQL